MMIMVVLNFFRSVTKIIWPDLLSQMVGSSNNALVSPVMVQDTMRDEAQK